MFDVAAGAPGIVAIGYTARPDMAATIWFSSDDELFETRQDWDVGSTRVNAIAWDGSQFVIVGEDQAVGRHARSHGQGRRSGRGLDVHRRVQLARVAARRPWTSVTSSTR